MRKLELLVTTGEIDGKRSRGQQRIKLLNGLAAWLGESTVELLRYTCEGWRWRVMIQTLDDDDDDDNDNDDDVHLS